MEGDEIAMISNSYSNISNNIGGGKDQEDHQVGNYIVKIQQENHVNRMTREWRRVFKRVSFRFVMRRRRKVAAARRAVAACVWKMRRMVDQGRKEQNVLLSYDMCSYSKNFDDGNWRNEEIGFFRTKSFSFRYATNPNRLAF